MLCLDLTIQPFLSAAVVSAGMYDNGSVSLVVEGHAGLEAAVVDAGTVSGRLGCGKDAVVLPRLALHRVLNQALMFSEGGRQTRDKTGFISHQAQVFFSNESAIGDVDGTRRVDPYVG